MFLGKLTCNRENIPNEFGSDAHGLKGARSGGTLSLELCL